MKSAIIAGAIFLLTQPAATTSFMWQQLPREQWGAPAVTVTQKADQWVIAGRTTTVTLSASNLLLRIQAGRAAWSMVPSSATDMIVRSAGEDVSLRLADARKIAITPYDTGFKTGVKVVLEGWRVGERELDVALFLTIAIEGRSEEVVFDVAAREGSAVVRQLDWPTALDSADIDHTVMSHYRGILLPRTWPSEFNPIRAGAAWPNETTEVQSNVIESWSMSWWGFQKGPSAMMVIVETPDDAAYQFAHPAGGPTVIGPRWRASLGQFRYPRTVRMAFHDAGNYVDMAKRYRRHAIDTGLFVPLTLKIAQVPRVASLIGTALTRFSILRNLHPDSARYDRNAPDKNYSLTTFDQAAARIRELKTQGFEKFHICLTGWPYLGYDRQHPDVLPPAKEAGGWDGMKRLTDTVRGLGYVFTLHDQYRDYYTDAPSYDTQFAVHEEDEKSPPQAFPGSRFGQWKEGRIPFMRHWDGGKQTYINSRFMLGHLRKNYELMFDHGIKPDGSYLDVFGYVPPDEDFNPQHPTTRSDSIRERAACYRWARNHLGIVGTEAAVDWTVPYADISSPLGKGRAGIAVPLFNLVYHDAIMTTYAPNDLYGFVNAGVPQFGLNALTGADAAKTLERVRQMAQLHEKLALLELTRHDFLDKDYKIERSTFADGTTVTVDWNTQTVTVK
jgi:hypothetical protein